MHSNLKEQISIFDHDTIGSFHFLTVTLKWAKTVLLKTLHIPDYTLKDKMGNCTTKQRRLTVHIINGKLIWLTWGQYKSTMTVYDICSPARMFSQNILRSSLSETRMVLLWYLHLYFLSTNRKPTFLQTEDETKFNTSIFQPFLKGNSIKFFTTKSENKTSI